MSRKMVGLSAALGAGLLAATMLQAQRASGPPAPAPPETPRARHVAAEGRVVAYPGAEVRVSAERGGRLIAVAIEEGQLVRRGELLARLDASELEAALSEARARAAEAEAEIRLAEASLARSRRLVEERIAAPHDLDQALRDVDIARARNDTALAEAARIEAQIAKTRIAAPITGTVVARSVDAGETLSAGDPVATLVDLRRLRVEGEADEADAAALAEGAAVRISADGYGGQEWAGSVEVIADAVTLRRLKPQDPSRPTDTRIIAVKVAFAEPTPLRLGTTVELRIAAVR